MALVVSVPAYCMCNCNSGQQAEASSTVTKLEKERDILEDLNSQLQDNQRVLKADLLELRERAARDIASKAAEIEDLQEQARFFSLINRWTVCILACRGVHHCRAIALNMQVRDLMIFIEAGRAVEASPTELRNATLIRLPPPTPNHEKEKKGGQRGKHIR
jgi:hypothetical protein